MGIPSHSKIDGTPPLKLMMLTMISNPQATWGQLLKPFILTIISSQMTNWESLLGMITMMIGLLHRSVWGPMLGMLTLVMLMVLSRRPIWVLLLTILILVRPSHRLSRRESLQTALIPSTTLNQTANRRAPSSKKAAIDHRRKRFPRLRGFRARVPTG